MKLDEATRILRELYFDEHDASDRMLSELEFSALETLLESMGVLGPVIKEPPFKSATKSSPWSPALAGFFCAAGGGLRLLLTFQADRRSGVTLSAPRPSRQSMCTDD
jgi:hypothetical protein